LTQRPISLLILVAAAVAAISFYAAPWFAFRAIREAAGQGDARALSQLIDYDAVRQGLEPELVDAPEPPPPANFWRDPIGAVKQAFAPPPPRAPAAQVNRYLTSAAIADLADGMPPGARPNAGAGEHHPFPVIRFWDPKRCRISVAQKRSPPAQFTFERRGLYTWKLVRILPPGEGPRAWRAK
jgi:hypothetical protein